MKNLALGLTARVLYAGFFVLWLLAFNTGLGLYEPGPRRDGASAGGGSDAAAAPAALTTDELAALAIEEYKKKERKKGAEQRRREERQEADCGPRLFPHRRLFYDSKIADTEATITTLLKKKKNLEDGLMQSLKQHPNYDTKLVAIWQKQIADTDAAIKTNQEEVAQLRLDKKQDEHDRELINARELCLKNKSVAVPE